MADKLSWTELRRMLANRADVTEKESNTFLNAFNAQLVEALKQDKQVKINGLGTFRLQAVAPRKSVNVTTGEEITIPGYNKIAFTPEAGVKELIEKGGAPVAVDPLQKLGAQAEEIVDILGDLGQSPKEEKKKKVKKEPKPVVVEEPKVEEPKIEEPKVEAPKPVVVEEPKPTIVEEPKIKAPKPVVVEEPKPVKEEKPKKKYHFVRDTLICVVILLLLLLIGYFFLRNRLSDWMEEILKGKPAQTEQVEAAPADAVQPEQAAQSEELTEEQILAEFLACSEEAEDGDTPDGVIYEELITIEPMHEASRLTWMAKRYYGDKVYWPYLYDANKDKISNPDQVAAGTPIRVPKLTKEQLDTTSVEFKRIQRAAEQALGE